MIDRIVFVGMVIVAAVGIAVLSGLWWHQVFVTWGYFN